MSGDRLRDVALAMYAAGYAAGHHDTVESCYTDVLPGDEEAMLGDRVSEALDAEPAPAPSDVESPGEHYDRLRAMRDDEGLTWDLSGNDRAAFRWAIDEIDRLRAAVREAHGILADAPEGSGKIHQRADQAYSVLGEVVR